jgi:hypothetical protein
VVGTNDISGQREKAAHREPQSKTGDVRCAFLIEARQ